MSWKNSLKNGDIVEVSYTIFEDGDPGCPEVQTSLVYFVNGKAYLFLGECGTLLDYAEFCSKPDTFRVIGKMSKDFLGGKNSAAELEKVWEENLLLGDPVSVHLEEVCDIVKFGKN